MSDSAVSASFSTDPFWWKAAPLDVQAAHTLPARCDVAIVGSGITGLVAALHLARRGRHVVVLDKDAPGEGASTRNAGYVGRTLKHGFGEIIAHKGLAFAVPVYQELMAAFLSVKDTVEAEKIDCHYQQQGRFLMATSPAMYEAMAREFELRRKHLGEVFDVVSPQDQSHEIASAHYFGGVKIEDHAGLQPALYHKGLLDAARKAGASVIGHTPVLGFTRGAEGFDIATGRGPLRAQNLVFATNGYSGAAFPWLRDRLISFDAYQAVSASLGDNRVASLLPGNRTFIDWNFNVDWVRRVPGDPSRLVFGGLTGGRNQDLRAMGARLKQRLLRIFPDLTDLQFDNVWTGKCAGTLDLYPHIGEHEGVHFAGGYCFAGVPMGTLFGQKLAKRILGQAGGESIFDRKVPSIPFYRGNPWFVPAAIRWMSRKDR